jgi:hypothetical protein
MWCIHSAAFPHRAEPAVKGNKLVSCGIPWRRFSVHLYRLLSAGFGAVVALSCASAAESGTLSAKTPMHRRFGVERAVSLLSKHTFAGHPAVSR